MSVWTLRLWLSGPLQSWGTGSRYDARHTDLVPSKSGVIGLVSAALGRARAEHTDDLARLRFGVRVEHDGTVLRDFHTVGAGVGGVAVASRAKPRGIVTERFYLQDASFVAGLEGGDRTLLASLYEALLEPRWLLSLGRRACPPAGVLVDERALVAAPLEEALAQSWCPAGTPPRLLGGDADVQLVLEDAAGVDERSDQPVGASFEARAFSSRRTRTTWIPRTPGKEA